MSGGRRSMGKRIHIGGYAEVKSLNVEVIILQSGATYFSPIFAKIEKI